MIAVTGKKGLGQNELLITVDGEYFPKDEAQRDVETAPLDDDEAGPGGPALVGTDGDAGIEEVKAQVRRAPHEPTELERIRQEATRMPYRSWCEYCVKGRRRCRPHYRRGAEDEDNAVPTVSMEYLFLGGEDGSNRTSYVRYGGRRQR